MLVRIACDGMVVLDTIGKECMGAKFKPRFGEWAATVVLSEDILRHNDMAQASDGRDGHASERRDSI